MSIPWNKGLTKDTDERVKKQAEAKRGHIPWNYGLTAKTDPIVAKYGKKGGLTRKGRLPWNKGLTKETDERLMIVSKKVSATRKRLAREGKLKCGHPQSEESRRKISETRKRLFAEGKIPRPNGGRGRKCSTEEIERRSKTLRQIWHKRRDEHDGVLLETCTQVNQHPDHRALFLHKYNPDGIVVDFANRKIVALEIERRPTQKRKEGYNPDNQFDEIMVVDISQLPTIQTILVKHRRHLE